MHLACKIIVIAHSVPSKTKAPSYSKESAFWPSNGDQSFNFAISACISHQTLTPVTLQHFRKRLCSCRCRSNVIYLFIWVIDTSTSITHTPTRQWPYFSAAKMLLNMWCGFSPSVFLCVYVRMATCLSPHVCVSVSPCVHSQLQPTPRSCTQAQRVTSRMITSARESTPSKKETH